MRITVEQALRLEGLNKCKLVAGKNGVGREIACVDAMEIPDIAPWLKEKELLLTTGYAIVGDASKQAALIEALHRAGAAGVAIKTRFLGSLSEEALALADRHAVPVIWIPDEMPSVELMMPLVRAILDIQNAKLDFSSKIHDKFTSLELGGGGLEGIADILHRLLSMPVVITDQNLKIYAAAPEGTVLRGSFGEALPHLIAWAGKSASEEDSTQLSCGRHFVVARKARFKGQVCSCLFIFCPQSGIDEMQMIALDHAATTAALEFSKLDSMSQRLSLMDNNCLIDIVMRNIKSEEEARHRARYLGWQSPPFFLTVFDIDNFEENTRGKTEMELLSLKQQVAGEIRSVLNREGVAGTTISQSDSFACLCAVKKAPKLAETARLVALCVKQKLGVALTAGLSTRAGSYTDIQRAYEEANDALNIGRLRKADVTFIGDVRLEQAVARCADKTYFERFVRETVGGLAAYDQKNDTDLLYTLGALIDNMGVRTQTARALYLHRNTLLARIRRIEEITGYDLSRSEKLMELGVALRIRPFL